MALFHVQDDKQNLHRERAKNILEFGNQCAADMLRLYNMGKDMLWAVDGFTVADAQKVLDEMAQVMPVGDLKVFQLHGAFGRFLVDIGVLKASDLVPPVSYKVENGRIVLTGSTYPTERPEEPQEVSPV